MEFKQIYKVLMIAVIALGSLSSVSAKTNISNNIIYNLEERDGILVGQTLYKQEGKTLTQYLKYNYVYNNQNKIVENNIEKWDAEQNKWVNGLTMRYNYDGQNVSIKSYKWDNDRNNYQLLPEKNKEFQDLSL